MNKPAWYFPRCVQRPLLLLSALLLAGSVQAEWFPIGRNENVRVYLDPKLIQPNGDFSQTWQLMDFTAAQWVDAQTVVGSIKNLIEYDCKQPRSRTLAGTAFSEQMGEGRMVANEQVSDPQWESIEPGSYAEKIRQTACGKK